MGGAEVHFHEIFRRIVKKGHKVTLVAHKFAGCFNEEIIDGIKIIRVGNKFLFHKQFKVYYKTNLKSQNFDLVVDDISKIPLNTPVYIHKPIVGILHHIHGNSLYKEIPFFLAAYIIRKEKQIPSYYKNTPIFTVSQSTTDELVKLGFDKDKTGILYNGIEQNLFESCIVKKSDTPLLTYVGRIKKYKNINQIIDAVVLLKKTIPNIKLAIGGKGDYLNYLKDYVNKLGLNNNIKFLGFLTEEEKAEILGKAWFFLTMAEKEGWGITVIEANAMKTPAIGSDVAGLRDSIQNKQTGYLVPLGNSELLANKIKELIKNKSEYKTLANKAYEWSKKFTWDHSANSFLERVIDWYPELKSKI